MNPIVLALVFSVCPTIDTKKSSFDYWKQASFSQKKELVNEFESKTNINFDSLQRHFVDPKSSSSTSFSAKFETSRTSKQLDEMLTDLREILGSETSIEKVDSSATALGTQDWERR